MDQIARDQKIFYKPTEAWFGDAIPFWDHGTFYIYYLYDERKTPVTADHTSWHLVSTKDFVHWEEQGEALPAGGDNDCDQACYTGSVIKGKDGSFHLFYTGQNPVNAQFGQDGKALQYILHATSKDLKHWEKHYDTAFMAPAGKFEPHDWRDPFVFFEEETGQYCMLLAARLRDKSLRKSGCVAVCHSQDLWSWEEAEVFYAPEQYFTHECPDLFREGEWWYLLYSTFTTKFVTHYRKSRSLQGPWKQTEDDALDARGMYAVKTASDGKKRYGFGWIPTWHEKNELSWLEWGGALAVHEVYALENGDLAVRLPDLIERIFGESKGSRISLQSDNTASAVFDDLPAQGLLEAEFEWDKEEIPIDFGIAFQEDEDSDEGYFFRFEPGYCRFVLDRWPRGDIYGEQHRMGGDIPFVPAFERPFDLKSGRLSVKLLLEEDICILYVNERTAMSVRMCRRMKKSSLFVTGGRMEAVNCGWRLREHS